MAIEYRQDSPYAQTATRGTYLDIYEHRPIPSYADDVLFTINATYEFRPDLLAYDLYSNQNLWWVFAVRNPNAIEDSIWDFRIGKKIYIPKQDTLTKALGI
jgi:hypothetical protein|tara:strand:- start:150 stop:452 length:303 start_codon:yes stop_codon:yes gene_type:complete